MYTHPSISPLILPSAHRATAQASALSADQPLPHSIFTVLPDTQSSPTSHNPLSFLPKKTSVNPCTTHQGQLTHSPRSIPLPTTHQSQLTHLPRSSHPPTDTSSPPPAGHQSQLIPTPARKQQKLQALPPLRETHPCTVTSNQWTIHTCAKSMF